jgi:hypothetical protein
LKNDLKKSIQYLDSSFVAEQNFNKIFQANTIKIAVEKDNYEKLLKKDDDILQEKKKHTETMIYFAVGFILFLIFAGFFYKRKRDLHKIELAENQRKIAEHEREIIQAKEYLEHFKKDITKKDEIIEQLSQNLSGKNERLLQDIVILTDNDWMKFRAAFETIYPLFFIKIKEKIPDISTAEMRLLALFKMNLSRKEIAHTLGVSPNTINVTWHRMRKKIFNAQENITPENFVKEV